MNIFIKDDQSLIEGCVKNHRSAQEQLYKKYFNKMYAMCLRYTNDQEIICSIINDAFLNVFKNIGKYENRGAFEGWIRRITFHSLADHFRKENKKIKFLLSDEHESYEIHDDKLTQSHDYEEILSKIELLTGACKEVFVKYAIEGYNHKEIADKLEISEGTSKWYLSEARKKLQSLLNIPQQSFKYGR